MRRSRAWAPALSFLAAATAFAQDPALSGLSPTPTPPAATSRSRRPRRSSRAAAHRSRRPFGHRSRTSCASQGAQGSGEKVLGTITNDTLKKGGATPACPEAGAKTPAAATPSNACDARQST